MSRGRRLIVVFLLGAACTTTEDVFGPAAGFARLDGFVRTQAGDPADGVQVLLTGCMGVPGDVGNVRTGQDGGYLMEAELPPASLVGPLDGDSLSIRCVLIAARDTSSAQTLDIWFWADPEDVTALAVNLTIR